MLRIWLPLLGCLFLLPIVSKFASFLQHFFRLGAPDCCLFLFKNIIISNASGGVCCCDCSVPHCTSTSAWCCCPLPFPDLLSWGLRLIPGELCLVLTGVAKLEFGVCRTGLVRLFRCRSVWRRGSILSVLAVDPFHYCSAVLTCFTMWIFKPLLWIILLFATIGAFRRLTYSAAELYLCVVFL